jgi:hypothetical protein
MKRVKQDVEAADDLADANPIPKPKPKPKPKLRGDRGKLAELTEFPFDVLLEVRSALSESASAL